MSFQNLNLVLKNVVSQPEWALQKLYLEIVEIWQELVGAKIAHQSRPHHVTQKVLWVAVASSVWSQELSLQRYSLLKKLSTRFDITLTDLRFSTAFWYEKNPPLHLDGDDSPHPRVVELPKTPILADKPAKPTPKEAFQFWQTYLDQRGQNLLPCPCCGIKTPLGELKRWESCAICFTKSNKKL